MASLPPGLFIRGFEPPLRLRDFRLVAFDMDSTLINIECVDEIAAAAGRKDEVAAITEAAIQSARDFFAASDSSGFARSEPVTYSRPPVRFVYGARISVQ